METIVTIEVRGGFWILWHRGENLTVGHVCDNGAETWWYDVPSSIAEWADQFSIVMG